eukprot:4622214-Pyramimonas_sp.AAC.1
MAKLRREKTLTFEEVAFEDVAEAPSHEEEDEEEDEEGDEVAYNDVAEEEEEEEILYASRTPTSPSHSSTS